MAPFYRAANNVMARFVHIAWPHAIRFAFSPSGEQREQFGVDESLKLTTGRHTGNICSLLHSPAAARRKFASLGVRSFDVGHVRVVEPRWEILLAFRIEVSPRGWRSVGLGLPGAIANARWRIGMRNRGYSEWPPRLLSICPNRGYFFTSGLAFLAAGSLAALYPAFVASSSVMNLPFFVLPKKAPSLW
jgi:hypothetical protein